MKKGLLFALALIMVCSACALGEVFTIDEIGIQLTLDSNWHVEQADPAENKGYILLANQENPYVMIMVNSITDPETTITPEIEQQLVDIAETNMRSEFALLGIDDVQIDKEEFEFAGMIRPSFKISVSYAGMNISERYVLISGENTVYEFITLTMSDITCEELMSLFTAA